MLPVPSPLAGGWGQRPGPLARQNMELRLSAFRILSSFLAWFLGLAKRAWAHSERQALHPFLSIALLSFALHVTGFAKLGRGCVARTIFYFVIAGLDPAIHGAAPHALRVSMDHRVKPGGDEIKDTRQQNRSRICAEPATIAAARPTRQSRKR